MTFGEKLQKLRSREGLSQDALAELLDVSRQAVSKWERNEAMPEAEKIVRISRRFGVTTDYLLMEDAPERPTGSGREFLRAWETGMPGGGGCWGCPRPCGAAGSCWASAPDGAVCPSWSWRGI